jgi:hypothetical protein
MEFRRPVATPNSSSSSNAANGCREAAVAGAEGVDGCAGDSSSSSSSEVQMQHVQVWLPPRALLVMAGESRYAW